MIEFKTKARRSALRARTNNEEWTGSTGFFRIFFLQERQSKSCRRPLRRPMHESEERTGSTGFFRINRIFSCRNGNRSPVGGRSAADARKRKMERVKRMWERHPAANHHPVNVDELQKKPAPWRGSRLPGEGSTCAMLRAGSRNVPECRMSMRHSRSGSRTGRSADPRPACC